jgi:hypothetical protein
VPSPEPPVNEKTAKGSNQLPRRNRSPETDAWLKQLPRGETTGWLTRAGQLTRVTWKHIAETLQAHIAYTTWPGHATARVATRDEELASRFAPRFLKAGKETIVEPTAVLHEILHELMQQQGDYSGFEREWRQTLTADIRRVLGNHPATAEEPPWDELTEADQELKRSHGVVPEWKLELVEGELVGSYTTRYAEPALRLLAEIKNHPQAGDNAGRYISRAIERIDHHWRQQHRDGERLRKETHERERNGNLAQPLHRRIAKRVSRAAERGELLATRDYRRAVEAADRQRREPAPSSRTITYAELRERDRRDPTHT